MINVPNNIKIDLRKEIAKGEETDRIQGMMLIKKYNPISQAQWKIKQDEIYLNTLRIKNDPSLGQLIANDLENSNQGDPVIIKQISLSLLLTITDKKISEYILDRLSVNEMNQMNQYWPKIIKDLKKNNLKLNKDTFISSLKIKMDGPTDINLLDDIDNNEAVPINPDMNENGDILDPPTYVKTPEEEKEIYPAYPKSNEKNVDFINRIMNSKTFDPQNKEEIKFFQETLFEITNLKTLGLISYISKKTNRNIKTSTRKSILETIALEVGIQHKIYWANYKERNEGNLKTGDGVKVKKMNKKKIVGKGKTESKTIIVNKFTVDVEKLNKNILSVKYTSCRAMVPSLKPEKISDDVKAVILDILEKKFNSKLFDKLMTDDQRIISNFVRSLKIQNINMDSFDQKYQREYELLLGEVNSGNSNQKVKMQLKQYILRGISENLIPRAFGLNQILHL